MKKVNTRNTRTLSTNSQPAMEKSTMKKTACNTRTLSTNSQPAMEKSTMKKTARNTRTLSTNSQPATEKAKRSYEREDLTGNFLKNFIASPKSEAASAFYAECADLLDRVWSELPESGIYDDVFAIASKVTQDPEYDPFKALCALIDTYDLNARQIRVVLQLCSPIITVCCDLTDRLSRYLGMSCANRMMGSACNELQCEKCGDFAQGLPFVRVCYNATRLGFTKGDPTACDIDRLVECIRYWLDPHDEEPKSSPKSSPKATPKSAKPQKAHEKASQIAALQDGIAALQAQLSKILSK